MKKIIKRFVSTTEHKPLPKVIFYTKSELDAIQFTFSGAADRNVGADRVETYSNGNLSKIDLYKEVVAVF